MCPQRLALGDVEAFVGAIFKRAFRWDSRASREKKPVRTTTGEIPETVPGTLGESEEFLGYIGIVR